MAGIYSKLLIFPSDPLPTEPGSFSKHLLIRFRWIFSQRLGGAWQSLGWHRAMLSTSAQLNPKPKMLCCPQSRQHSILGFGFNDDYRLNSWGKLLFAVSLTPTFQVGTGIASPHGWFDAA